MSRRRTRGLAGAIYKPIGIADAVLVVEARASILDPQPKEQKKKRKEIAWYDRAWTYLRGRLHGTGGCWRKRLHHECESRRRELVMAVVVDGGSDGSGK